MTLNPLLSRLIETTPFSRHEILILSKTAPFRYKTHYIEKRKNRGKRLISQPTAELKYIQRHLISTELNAFRTSEHATAYVQGRGIKFHAQQHAKQHFLLKMDFKDFFPSIRPQHLSQVIGHSARYSDEELQILFNFLYRFDETAGELRLSIGAPSSPYISNLISTPFDDALSAHCAKLDVKYSRYADDLAFSSNTPGILDQIQETVKKLSQEILNLELNDKKTVNVSTKNRRSLTGLVLANDGTVSIARQERRILRARIHKIFHGEADGNISDLTGKLAFLYSIDPEFVIGTLRRYGFSSIEELRKQIVP